MKAQIRLKNITVEVEAETQKELFGAAASAAEVFGESECGLCKSADIRPVVRHVAGAKNKQFDYYEMQCMNTKCRAKLAFGCNLEGGSLFPKRKLKENGEPDMAEGKFGPHNGWTKYRGEPKDDNAKK